MALGAAAEPDVIVAVGGGSVIDLAKVTALLLAHGAPLADYYAVQSVPGPIVPLIALPTTAGTGSEATPVAVITDPATEMKIGVASPHLIPRHAICDPLLTIGAPPIVTAHSGIDALSHAVESFMAAREEPSPELVLGRPQVGKNLLSDALALTAAGHIFRNLARAVEDGSDLEARTGMLYGSLLAGIAFGNSGVSAAHALQFALGAATHTSHGLGTGLLLPYVMEFNRPARPDEIAELSALMGGDAVSQVHALGAADRIAARRWPRSAWRRTTCARWRRRPWGSSAWSTTTRGRWTSTRSRRSSTRPGTVSRPACAPSAPPSAREVAHGALEMRRHARLGGPHVARLEHVEHLVMLAPDRRRRRPARPQLGDAEPDLAAQGAVEALQARRADCADERVVEGGVGGDDLAPAGVVG